MEYVHDVTGENERDPLMVNEEPSPTSPDVSADRVDSPNGVSSDNTDSPTPTSGSSGNSDSLGQDIGCHTGNMTSAAVANFDVDDVQCGQGEPDDFLSEFFNFDLNM